MAYLTGAYSPARILAAGILVAAPLFATASLAQQPPQQAAINVSAEGDATLVPDMATVSLSVVSQADDTATALSDNSAAMTKVIDALKASGIAETDIQTTDFSVSPRYDQVKADDGTTQSRITGYEVHNGLAVKIRDLSKLGSVLDQSVKLGVNSGGGISFSNSDPSKAEDEARREAVANALAKAKTLAEAAGVTLGDVLSISEQSSSPQPVMFRAMAMAKADSAVPVAAGENTYSVNVNMTFGIGQ
ncbi:SIMPL domain-containing protein [Martelella endophytica]|uniref:Membrane protein n=1 Tax=Martelella endophytica TaxID=1486262 RepID=A0A0D5LMX4_MAREN|nr:SIMPL domain-containing protein [Martelella endophytica]AJY45564.1 membrane protein [Martelella endophytica]